MPHRFGLLRHRQRAAPPLAARAGTAPGARRSGGFGSRRSAHRTVAPLGPVVPLSTTCWVFRTSPRAEIDALAEAHLGTGRPQPPHGAARQPQRGAAAIRRSATPRPPGAGESAARRPRRSGRTSLSSPRRSSPSAAEIQLARIGHPETLAIAVMRRGDPLMAALLGALAAHRCRGAAERAVGRDLDRVGVADDQHRVRRARPRHPPPGRVRAAIAAAIDDDPLASLAELERQRARHAPPRRNRAAAACRYRPARGSARPAAAGSRNAAPASAPGRASPTGSAQDRRRPRPPRSSR